MSSTAISTMALINGFFEWFGELGLFSWQVLRAALRRPFEFRELARQVDEIGSKSFPLVALAGAAIGAILALETRDSLVRFGASSLLPAVVVFSIVHEIGPIVTGLVVCGRAGAGIGAELGSMKVTEQIDAMRALGVNHIRKLVVPRVLVTMLAMPMLTIIADALGIFGGMVISQYEFNVEYHQYYNTITQYVKLADMIDGLGKTVVFGFLIGVIGCYRGLETRGGTEGLGRSTTGTVVTSSLAVFISDFFLTKFFWWLAGW